MRCFSFQHTCDRKYLFLTSLFTSFHLTQNRSRIIAINPDGSLRWSFVLDGQVAGTPAIGLDKEMIYVSHNIPNTVENGEKYRGMLTVLRDSGDGPIVAAEMLPENSFGPFGPLTLQTTITDDDTTDVVFVAESWGGGYTNNGNGNVYYVNPSSSGYTLQVFSEWGFSSVAAPTVSAGAEKLWMGGVGSNVGGWVSDSSLITSADTPLEPVWQYTFVQQNERNVTMRKYTSCE